MTRRVLASVLVAGAALAAPAHAEPIPDLDVDPPIHTFCTVYFQPVPIFTDDVPVQPVVPRFAC